MQVIGDQIMNDDFEIPKHSAAGVAFLGVEFNDSLVAILGVFVGLGVGLEYGAMACIGCAVGGFFLNKAYLDWREGLPPGHMRARLFRMGILGYSGAFKAGDVVFVGDATVINPGSSVLVDQAEVSLRKAQVLRGA
jgi:hypothetical protein